MGMPARLANPEVLIPIRDAIMHASATVSASSLEPEIGHLVSLRASQLNGCAFCLSMHVRELREDGWSEDKIAVLPAWRETDWFTPRERAALAWTEALTHIDPHGVSDDVFATASTAFSEEELAMLTLEVIAINGWNRVNIAFHTTPDHWESPALTETNRSHHQAVAD
jgi:AhpD family alkylhydroperoxidase